MSTKQFAVSWLFNHKYGVDFFETKEAALEKGSKFLVGHYSGYSRIVVDSKGTIYYQNVK